MTLEVHGVVEQTKDFDDIAVVFVANHADDHHMPSRLATEPDVLDAPIESGQDSVEHESRSAPVGIGPRAAAYVAAGRTIVAPASARTLRIKSSAVTTRDGAASNPAAHNTRAIHVLQVLNKWNKPCAG